MINYAQFRTLAALGIRRFLPEKYNGRVSLTEGRKVNRLLDLIEINPIDTASGTGLRIAVRDLYGHYCKCGSLEEVFRSAAVSITEGLEKGIGIRERLEMKNIRQQVIFSLIHREQNRELLKDLPHRAWNDLAVIYFWIIRKRTDGHLSSLVDHRMAEAAGMDEEELFMAAVQNTMRIYPPKVENLLGRAKKRIEEAGEKLERDVFMYAISNTEHFYGAANVLYANLLFGLAEKAGSDLYLLPSSVHEMIAVSTVNSLDSLAEMVRETNYRQVSLDEQLSNQIYLFRRDTGNVTLATDRPFEGFSSAVDGQD